MKILGWIVALPFIALALFIAARFVMCRPDSEVVRVATPMVEKIADYIVKHGVPESLADIPGLPYALEGCSKTMEYKKNGKIVSRNESDLTLLYISCSLEAHKRKYNLHLMYNNWIEEITLKIVNKEKNTGLSAKLKKNKNNRFKIKYIGDGYILFHKGICSQFKQ